MACVKGHDGNENKLVACPVCHRDVLLSSADQHVGICLLRTRNKTPAQKRRVTQTQLGVLWRRSLVPLAKHTEPSESQLEGSCSLPFDLPPLEPRASLGLTLCGEKWRRPSAKQLSGSGFSPNSNSEVCTTRSLDLSTAGCHARAHQASLLPTIPVELEKIIVSLRGRRHRPNIAAIPKVGTTLAVVREVENPADTRALRCILCRTDNTSGVKEIYDDFVGYLPRQVSAHLSPLVDAGLLIIWARVSLSESDVVSLDEIELHGQPCSFGDTAELSERIIRAWKAAVGAAVDARVGLQETIRRRLFASLERLQCASSAHAHLLREVEASAFERLRACSASAQALVIRLLQRKTTWLRSHLLIKYSEILEPQVTVSELCSVGLLCSGDEQGGTNIDMTDRLEALTRDELVTLARKFNLDSRLCKKKLVTLLNAIPSRAHGEGRSSLFRAWLDTLGGQSNMIRLSHVLLQGVKVVLFLTFLRPSCDLSDLASQDLGRVSYPTAAKSFDSQALRASHSKAEQISLFPSRKHLDAYLSASSESACVDAAIDAGDESTALEMLQVTLSRFLNAKNSPYVAISPSYLRRFSHEWIRAEMASVGVALLERKGLHSKATEVLFGLLSGCNCPEKRGTWYIRASTNLEQHLGRQHDAIRVCEAGLQDSWVRCGDRIRLQRRLLRLARRHKRWGLLGAPWRVDVEWEAPVDMITARALNASVPEKNRYCTILDDGDAVMSVENLALAHYAGDEAGNWRGIHSEFRVWATLFGLLFVEVIMLTPIPGNFQSPCSTAPLDFATDSFAPKRHETIIDNLFRIRKGEARDMIRAAWRHHHRSAIPGVSWTLLTLEDLCEIVDGLGGVPLASIMGLMADDYSGWSCGAPDLILWRSASDEQVKAVEVKSTNDRLSDQQRAWLLALRDAGVQVAVCKVM